jgi:hypothetical protein
LFQVTAADGRGRVAGVKLKSAMVAARPGTRRRAVAPERFILIASRTATPLSGRVVTNQTLTPCPDVAGMAAAQ